MLATNHGLVGTYIGAMLPIPIAVPVAFTSHFILDMVPHYGVKGSKRNSKSNRIITYVDIVFALSLALFAAIYGKWDMFWIGWVAYGPDLYWVYLYFKNGKSLIMKPRNWFAKLHKNIQFERSWGLYIELSLILVMFPLYLHFLFS